MACCMQTAYCQPPAIEWDRSFGGLKQEEMYAMIQTADGGYLLGGDSDSPISGAKTQGSQGINDYWVVRTNGSGNKLWDKRFGGSSREELFAVKQTPDGGFILGGWSMSAISGDQTQISRGRQSRCSFMQCRLLYFKLAKCSQPVWNARRRRCKKISCV